MTISDVVRLPPLILMVTQFFSIEKISDTIATLQSLPEEEQDFNLISLYMLTVIDFCLALLARERPCPNCGAIGGHHQAHYHTKTRFWSVSEQDAQESGLRVRFSFCCNTCRTRISTPSVRFEKHSGHCKISHLLFTIFRKEKTPRRELRSLSRILDVPYETLKYWLRKENAEETHRKRERIFRVTSAMLFTPPDLIKERIDIFVNTQEPISLWEFFGNYETLLLLCPPEEVRTVKGFLLTHRLPLKGRPP